MSRPQFIFKMLQCLFALVWVANGLLCKVLDLVPRHRHIVGQILGEAYSSELTILIGVGELFIAAWVLSNYKVQWLALVQILLVTGMNIIEFLLVPEYLLWGRYNLLFATLFSLLIYYTYFVLYSKLKPDSHA